MEENRNEHLEEIWGNGRQRYLRAGPVVLGIRRIVLRNLAQPVAQQLQLLVALLILLA